MQFQRRKLNKMQIDEEIFEALQMIKEDQDASKKLKEDIDKVVKILKEEEEESLRVEKAILELEDINNKGVPSYIKTMLWDVISSLEGMRA